MPDSPIARLRRDRNMTQARLAEACGVSLRTVKRAERGAALSAETMAALCAVLGCPPSDLQDEVAVAPQAPTSERERLGPPILLGCLVASLCDVVGMRTNYLAALPEGTQAVRGSFVALLLLSLVAMFLTIPAMYACRRARWVAWSTGRSATLGDPRLVAVLAGMVAPAIAGGIGARIAEGQFAYSQGTMVVGLCVPFAVVVASVTIAVRGIEESSVMLHDVRTNLLTGVVAAQLVSTAVGETYCGAYVTLALLAQFVLRTAKDETPQRLFGLIATAAAPISTNLLLEMSGDRLHWTTSAPFWPTVAMMVVADLCCAYDLVVRPVGTSPWHLRPDRAAAA